MVRPTLIQRYAEQLGLSPVEAKVHLFRACVPRGKRMLVQVHRLLRPRLYQADVRLVEEAAMATNVQGVLDALDRWNHRLPAFQSLARDRWHWRVSGRCLVTVALASFADSPMTVGAEPVPAPTPTVIPSVNVPADAAVSDFVRAHG